MPNSAPPREAVSVINQNFLVDAPCSLSVDVPGAHTRLRPGPEDERVNVDISVEGCPPEKAEKILNQMEVGTQKKTDTVYVYSDIEPDRSNARWWRWVRTLDVTIHVDLRLPSRVEADLRVPGGEVDVAGLQGHIDIEVMGGPCRVENLKGTLDIRAESSDVSIQNFTGEEVIARVAAGSLAVSNADANTITLRSVAGPMTLSSVTGSTTVTAKSSSVDLQSVPGPCLARAEGGTLTYNGQPEAEIELQVVGTSLNTHLPADHGAALSMSGLALTLADAFSFEGERAETEIEGTLNGGGPSLTLAATGGSVNCLSS